MFGDRKTDMASRCNLWLDILNFTSKNIPKSDLILPSKGGNLLLVLRIFIMRTFPQITEHKHQLIMFGDRKTDMASRCNFWLDIFKHHFQKYLGQRLDTPQKRRKSFPFLRNCTLHFPPQISKHKYQLINDWSSTLYLIPPSSPSIDTTVANPSTFSSMHPFIPPFPNIILPS